jgi:hypothetical protein
MSLKIVHKNSSSSGTPPASGDIDVGELAINAADAELYTKDLNGNIRKFQNTTTGTAGGVKFTQAGAGAVQRTVDSKLKEVVSVKDFGAVGDGVTNDNAAFAAAYAAAPEWGTIVIPSGEYVITPDLTGSKLVRWLSFGATYPGGPPLSLPGIVETTYGRSLNRRTQTAPTDSAVLEIQRISNHTGGTTGFVTPALQVSTQALDGSENFEWGLLSTLENYSTAADNSENVSIYAQATKHSSGRTWGIVSEVRDLSGAATATVAHGIELTCIALTGSSDPSFQRAAAFIALNSDVLSGDMEWGRGYWAASSNFARFREVFSNTGRFSKAAFWNSGAGVATIDDIAPTTFKDTGTATYGIDLTGATYSSSVAIRIKEGNQIAFETTNTVVFAYAAGVMFLGGAYLRPGLGFDFDSGTGITSTTATAGVQNLPSNPSGFVKIRIDGVEHKMPYYES